MKKKFDIRNNYTLILLGLFIITLGAFSLMKFNMLWKLSTWKSMAMQLPEYGVMTLGVMVCFISGNIDISFVALGDFASIIAVKLMLLTTDGTIPEEQTGIIILLALLLAMVIGAVGGLLNGNLISRFGIPPILATLATQQVFKGLSTALTKGYAVTGLPEMYSEIGHTMVFGFLPVPLLVFIIVLLFISFLLKYTTYGEKLYMLGTNTRAARFSGINTTRMINMTFMINGVIAAIGAMLMVSSMNSAKADYGTSYMMRCILILVLAGCLPNGGMGKVFDVLIAIVIIQIIATGVNMFPELNSYYGSLIWGALLIIILVATTRLVGEAKARKKKKAELPAAVQ